MTERQPVRFIDPFEAWLATGLATELEKRGIERIFVCGLATDYCVKNTALDGLKAGLEVVLVRDACRGVDLPPGSAEAAIEQMKKAGVRITTSQAFE